MQTSGKTRFAP
ncbi:TPA: hypothetical protein N0F65_001744 [Lagenidium giganteum]|uniref:Uncharacterized protein n=1 Tax=Lagenidium giganteum TaxID=4803 RepID=A0AAV2Z407_9STRA|nr:TPA: hypothetical protein N0F65_001744 [Lagenidium giganteum]